MSREALQESLSAVMDNEADELELRRVLNALDDADTRATWSRYQIARAVMHKDLLDPRLDIASAVSAALAGEDVPAKSIRGPWRTLGRLAVAASVTVAVLAGVRFYNQDDIVGAQLAQQANQPGLAAPTAKGPAVLAGYTEGSEPTGPMASGVLQQGQAGWDQRLPGYLRQHAQEAALKGTESALPYARAASLETAK
ncbi:RseA family anti-sigma factor [Pseudomonas fuscovaginae UPB0736]|uniref:Anti sigma-E protein, RseA n=1 Tax=Pseudomonas asplenii TaxID=53407 RepID=A0A1H6NBS6_9PSED|nr:MULTISPECIES: RseA family anti-sigma factor [Pseudomonas]UUQ66378.1 RseA family anti-sigma factor [Pseudomonas fuscovaginae UPB0736]UZE30399.1 anti-sigma factor [Pseudomonas asplenii]SEI12404.1 anti sigma-E protein, RseA [Pseudomonas fuscovaginae]